MERPGVASTVGLLVFVKRPSFGGMNPIGAPRLVGGAMSTNRARSSVLSWYLNAVGRQSETAAPCAPSAGR